MKVLFIGGTASQVLAAAALQRRGVDCMVISAAPELEAPWLAVQLCDLYDHPDATRSTRLPPGLSLLHIKLAKDVTDPIKKTFVETSVASFWASSPLVTLASTLQTDPYFRFEEAALPALSLSELIPLPVSTHSLLHCKQYSTSQRRAILRFLRALREFVQSAYFWTLEETERGPSDRVALGDNDDTRYILEALQAGETALEVGNKFRVPETFLRQVLRVPLSDLPNVPFSDLLVIVIYLLQSFGAYRPTTAHLVLEYGLSDVAQTFERFVFSAGGLVLRDCQLRFEDKQILIDLPTSEHVPFQPDCICLSSPEVLPTFRRFFFILRQGDLLIELQGLYSEEHYNYQLIIPSGLVLLRVGSNKALPRDYFSIDFVALSDSKLGGFLNGEEALTVLQMELSAALGMTMDVWEDTCLVSLVFDFDYATYLRAAYSEDWEKRFAVYSCQQIPRLEVRSPGTNHVHPHPPPPGQEQLHIPAGGEDKLLFPILEEADHFIRHVLRFAEGETNDTNECAWYCDLHLTRRRAACSRLFQTKSEAR
ncbi:hypothetical protein GMRT_13481 [Giardia muris]|uniref:Uncharacterized protein n=1 Tax=Giardia muris TaxID=5742 RepID=A0A4Z1SQB9_GIAMU|nr:hypothetical protein GMRT_13481 [Giardia muris]|eukprot:TNJ28006.1 hypothetical protein GMRT_13481 [Giardia muris]